MTDIPQENDQPPLIPEGIEPEEYLRSVLSNAKAEVSEKIRAAKALDDIRRRSGGILTGQVSELSRGELVGEIARIRALVEAQGIEKPRKPSPSARKQPRG